MNNTLPRLVVVTKDGSRWMLDEEYVAKVWTDYCSDVDRHLDPPKLERGGDFFAAMESDHNWDDHNWNVNWEADIFPHARLVSASDDLSFFLRYGVIYPEPDDITDYAERMEDDTYNEWVQEQQLGEDLPKFELATAEDLNPDWTR